MVRNFEIVGKRMLKVDLEVVKLIKTMTDCLMDRECEPLALSRSDPALLWTASNEPRCAPRGKQ